MRSRVKYVKVGASFTHRFIVTNNKSTPAFGVQVKLDVPNYITVSGASPSTGSFDDNVWYPGTVKQGDIQFIDMTFVVDSSLGFPYTIVAKASSVNKDFDLSNNDSVLILESCDSLPCNDDLAAMIEDLENRVEALENE